MGKTYRTTSRHQRRQVPTFTVAGVYVDVDKAGNVVESDEEWEEMFRCLPVAPGGTLDDLSSAVSVDEHGNMTFSKVSVLRFIRSVIVEGDEHRFDQMVRDKRRMVELEILGEIMMDLSAEYTGRPTGPQRTSPGSSADTATGSTPNSSSSDGTPTSSMETSPPSFT